MKKLGNIHQMIVDQLESGMVQDGCEFVFSVKANAIGDLFVAMLRKVLNRTRYTIRIRGSQSDRKSLREQGFLNVNDQSVPLEHADRYRIYIEGIKTVEITANKERAYESHVRRLNGQIEVQKQTITAYMNEILDYKGQVKRLTEAGVLYRENLDGLRKEIADMKAAAYSRLFNSALPETFAVMFNNSVYQELVQLAAFERGYRWLDDFGADVRKNWVKRHKEFKAVVFEYKDGRYTMSYVTETEHLTCASVVFDVAQENGFIAYIQHLERMSYCQMTADEHRLFMYGQKLQAVKAIKDRTGLGLYEAKRIIDSVPVFGKK